ncbi:MAG: restriction endonuclease, partial [Propionicimonas sp.]|nr:restriction endonuclease [Propionicimonas sp.]
GGPKAITDRSLRALASCESLPEATLATLQELATGYRFFHWHLELPHLFRPGGPADGPGWSGGFDVVLGNPPWERVKLQEQEFFAVRDPQIAAAPNAAARKRLIQALEVSNPSLHDAYLGALRRAAGESHLLRVSGRYPLTGRGDINTYAVFAEACRNLVNDRGRMGIIVPTGIATDATTQFFFKDLVQRGNLASLYDFENAKPLFEGVHRSFKFCLLTLTGRDERAAQAKFAVFAHDPSDLLKDDARFELTPDEIQLLNPNTGTCPVFRTRRDAEITLGIYRRVPVLINENDPVNGNPWGISFMRMFDMSNDSHLFHTRDELEADGWTLNGNVFERSLDGGVTRMLPLFEAKMIHLYDTRWATYEPDGSIRPMTEEEKAARLLPIPRYWLAEADVNTSWGNRKPTGPYFAWRGIARTSDVRTAIGTVMPAAIPGGGNFDMVLGCDRNELPGFAAVFSSFVLDFVARQKLSNMHLQFSVAKQLPMATPEQLGSLALSLDRPLGAWVALRVDRLNGWIPNLIQRAHMRAELDAMMFHVYGLTRPDVSYVMDTFPIVKRNDEAAFGTYRTKDLILSAYDAMAQAKSSGRPYQPPWPQEIHA